MLRNLFLCSLLLSTAAFAAPKTAVTLFGDRAPASTAGSTHEILLNLSDYRLNNFSTATVSFGNETRIAFGGAYFHQLFPSVQIGGKMGVQHVSYLTLFEMIAAARYNIPINGGTFENAVFAGAGLGFGMMDSGLSQTTLLVDFEFGKRFLLFPHLTWQPSVEIKIPTSGLYDDVMVAFRFLTLSVVF